MIRFLILLMGTLLSPSGLVAQNLVPNPSFEKVNKIFPRWIPNHMMFEENIKEWTTPNEGSPDILFEKIMANMKPPRKGVDLSPHQPRTGKMTIGIKTYGCETMTQHCKEYIQVKLKERINKGAQYFIEFWVNPMSTSIYTNNIGLAFSDAEIQDDSEYGIHYFEPVVNEKNVVENVPNDWHRIATTVTADGDYDYIIIGNFYTDGDTEIKEAKGDLKYSYYLIDDVVVRPLNAPKNNDLSMADLELGSAITLNNILFETAKATLLPASYKELDQLRSILEENATMTIQINGHTDNQGSADYNLKLSKERASAVVDYLAQKGIAKERMEYKGFGERQAIASNDTPDGQQLNRRVEFVILTK